MGEVVERSREREVVVAEEVQEDQIGWHWNGLVQLQTASNLDDLRNTADALMATEWPCRHHKADIIKHYASTQKLHEALPMAYRAPMLSTERQPATEITA